MPIETDSMCVFLLTVDISGVPVLKQFFIGRHILMAKYIYEELDSKMTQL